MRRPRASSLRSRSRRSDNAAVSALNRVCSPVAGYLFERARSDGRGVREMGLPAGQQRVLDTIEEALGTADPRLATMYAIFTRLTGNEARPYREQLPFARGWRSWPTRMR